MDEVAERVDAVVADPVGDREPALVKDPDHGAVIPARRAIGAARTKNSYLQTRYRRLAGRTSTLKALVAVEHAIITAIWHMLTTGTDYRDLGADYYQRRDPAKTMRRIIKQANDIGLTVRFDPIAQPAH